MEDLERLIAEIEVLQHVYGVPPPVKQHDGHTNRQDENGNGDGNENLLTSHVRVLSTKEFHAAKTLVLGIVSSDDDDDGTSSANDDGCELNVVDEDDMILPELRVEIQTTIRLEPENDNDTDNDDNTTTTGQQPTIITTILHLTLPPGYPSCRSAIVSYVAIQSMTTPPVTRSLIDSIQSQLVDRAKSEELNGIESMLDLVQALQEYCRETLLCKFNNNNDDDDKVDHPNLTQQQQQQFSSSSSTQQQQRDNNDVTLLQQQQQQKSVANNKGCRCWIWVHHITDVNRRKSIVQEAHDKNLVGYLKSGYPGIIVIEGTHDDCQSFITWVKGNKSRPNGGFGRQWGHHVRGEIVFESESDDWKLSSRSHPVAVEKGPSRTSTTSTDNTSQSSPPLHIISRHSQFQDIEDMADLAKICKDVGLEDEFLTYVMQHK